MDTDKNQKLWAKLGKKMIDYQNNNEKNLIYLRKITTRQFEKGLFSFLNAILKQYHYDATELSYNKHVVFTFNLFSFKQFFDRKFDYNIKKIILDLQKEYSPYFSSSEISFTNQLFWKRVRITGHFGSKNIKACMDTGKLFLEKHQLETFVDNKPEIKKNIL